MSLLSKAEETSVVSWAIFPSVIRNCRGQTVVGVTCFLKSIGNDIGSVSDFNSGQFGLSLANECIKARYCPQGVSCHSSQYSAQNRVILS